MYFIALSSIYATAFGIGKEVLKGNNYGNEKFSKTENLELEIGDGLFSLMCLANTLDINMEEALDKVLDKYNKRFEEKGSIGSETI